MLARAAIAYEAKCAGVVASPLEAEKIRKALGPSFLIVTPGVRLAATSDDQKRVATPANAIAAGSDYLVIGRPIIAAPDPPAVARAIIADIAKAAGA